MSSAIMALKLKRFYRVPWIMHLSDPWADAPRGFDRRSLKLNQKLERECLEEADIVTLTSNSTIEFFQRKYPHLKARFELSPNVYDPDDIVTEVAPVSSRERIRIVYTGGLAGSRSPQPFLQALRALPQSLRDRLEVVLSGHADRNNRIILDEYADFITYLGPLTYRNAIALQRTADVLLLIDTAIENPDLRVFFPSKALDYQITGKPILAIVDPGSECETFINTGLGRSFDRRDVGGIRDFLAQLTDDQASSRFFDIRPARREFDASLNAQRLASLFEKTIHSSDIH